VTSCFGHVRDLGATKQVRFGNKKSIVLISKTVLKWLNRKKIFLHTYIQIYFCNTQMKLLQHTSETDETFRTYTCNIAIATYATFI
jgi:hypothetical protein